MRKTIVLSIYLILTPLLAYNGGVLVGISKQEESAPDWLRIKRRCGIPDSVMWSYETKIKYSKQIEETIKSMN
jgi:hypothetical protein